MHPIHIILLLSLILAPSSRSQTVLPLWDGPPPGAVTDEPQRFAPDRGDGVRRLTHVSRPTLTVYLAPGPQQPTQPPAPLVVVCPGGGYRILALDKEGAHVAAWLNSLGLHAAVLHYRVPDNRAGALLDARRAMQKVREHAQAWNADPQRIIMLGFSAGAHLTAACAATADRPAATALIYPAYLSTRHHVELVDTLTVDAHTPPAFIVQTRDDKNHYRSALAYAAALSNADRPVELHLFANGGHGYGLEDHGHPVNDWPRLFELWMRDTKLLGSKAP